MTPEQAIREASEQKLRPVYLLVGEEQKLEADVVHALRAAVAKGGILGLNEDLMQAQEIDADTALAAARTLPMMAKRRFVLVRGLEAWEGRESSDSKGLAPLDKLAEYAQNPSPTTTLVLVGSGLDKRRKLVAAARKDGFLVSCEVLSRADLPAYIERAARERESTLAPGVAELIAELSGPELGPVTDALERSCLYAGKGREVTEEIVSECVVRLRTKTVWELVGAVGRRDSGAALAALDEVYDPQDRGLRLVGLLAWSARQLLRFESALAAGLSQNDAAVKAGAPPFKARELADQLKRVARADLERWLETLAELDYSLKGGSRRPPKAVLEHAILKLCRGTESRFPERAAERRA
ncbi:MAG TPA: DNA polymerase III subunit delta [Polyangiaceae bacterium]|jgi:DNA polymerase-3 subunit delta|nr:DNA polymerase III subunit delta [Polyangiaceae bacterium]